MELDDRPCMLYADENGDIYDHPELVMIARKGLEAALPRPDEMTPLPRESELFLLPGRRAVGLDPETGELEVLEERAVAAFVCPGHTVTGVSYYVTDDEAPLLPLLSFAAVGWKDDRFWVCASRTDEDRRQVFTDVPNERIERGARELLAKYPDNRLIGHLSRCALTYCCPAAKNFALGRFEAPLPTAQACNARCVGCISLQPCDSGFVAPQNRISFRPKPAEIAEVMAVHAKRTKKPILSFGQGCEGEPLTEADTIAKAVRLFRKNGGKGTVNVNTNASLPDAAAKLADAGVDSFRVSLNSARSTLYEAYYRPQGYTFDDVAAFIKEAKRAGSFVSLNYLYFPGIGDQEEEIEALSALVGEHAVDFIQLRNLNLDPELYLDLAGAGAAGPATGLKLFKKRLRKAQPELKFGYFNPYLGV